MKNFKNIAYSLVAIISFSLISAGAHAGVINIRVGGFGYGDLAYYSPGYTHYRRPVVSYRHHYKPYHGYRNYGYRNYGSPHHSRQRYRPGIYKSYGRSSNYNRRGYYQSGHSRNRIGYNKRH